MHLDIQALALKFFVALGGVALILKLAKGNVRKVVDYLWSLVMKIPGASIFVSSHKDELKGIVDEAHDEIDKDIDQAKP